MTDLLKVFAEVQAELEAKRLVEAEKAEIAAWHADQEWLESQRRRYAALDESDAAYDEPSAMRSGVSR